MPADHKFLYLMEFEFDLRSGALSGLIPGAKAFGNQTFKSEFASPVQKLAVEPEQIKRVEDDWRPLLAHVESLK
jgi:hypothetical protein